MKTYEPMTNPRFFRKFSGLTYFFAFGALLGACSSSEGEPGGGGGSSGSPAGTSGSGGTNASGSGNTSGSSSGSTTGGTPSGPSDVVGSFQVQLVVDTEDPEKGSTSVIGKVNDGSSPANLVWTTIKEEGDCRLEKPSVPFCDPGCGADVCVADGECQAYPKGQSAGEVTLSGVKLAGGESSLVLKEVVNAYQPPANTTFAWPPFAEGDEVTVKAAGDAVAAFELKAQGVKPMVLMGKTYEVAEGKQLDLAWEAAGDSKASQVHLKLDISHHGGTRGMIQCDTDDTGSLSISGAMITELIGLGTAGFPTFVLTRSTRGEAQLTHGVVELEVSAKVEQAVMVAGVTSCTEDSDCADGETCQDDLTCM